MDNVFPALIGNKNVKQLLAADVLKKTLSHAYIIEGPRGSGRHLLADSIASALLCTGNGDTVPCGKCPSCKKYFDGFCTDVYKLSRGDKATISVDSVRTMIQTLEFAPDDGDYKFYFIEEAERLTVQAQNTLLLSLEEPPAYAIFFLLTTDAKSLLETVRSRAPVIRTELFTPDATEKWLSETPAGKKASKAQIADASAVSGGALGAALEALSKNCDSMKFSSLGREIAEVLCFSGRADALLYCTSLKATSQEFGEILFFAAEAIRDMTSVKCGSDRLVFYTDAEALSEKCRSISVKKLCAVYEKIITARRDIATNFASSVTVMATLAASART